LDVEPSSKQVDVAWVPGSFEIPLVAQLLARSGSYNVVITLGAVIRGDTPHFDVVVAEVSKGVAAVARDTGVPVIFGVLTTDNLQQALERAGIKSNLGWSYALQALEMGSLMGALAEG
jgi:6,7-dimethyl-8-ribityllumazine synthase